MKRKQNKKQKLHLIYDEVPKVACTGKCSDQCTLIPMAKNEKKIIRKLYRDTEFFGLPLKGHFAMVADKSGDKLVCRKLGPMNRCEIYKDRPLICRLYGVTEDLLCPHGCKPDSVLTKEEVRALMQKIEAL